MMKSSCDFNIIIFGPKHPWFNPRYEGEWAAGLREGTGKYFSKSTGASYEGDYKNDLKVIKVVFVIGKEHCRQNNFY